MISYLTSVNVMLDADAVINISSQKVGGSNAYLDPPPEKVGGSGPRKTHWIYAPGHAIRRLVCHALISPLFIVEYAGCTAVIRSRQQAFHTAQGVRYDTIRDAILTCARKPTRVSLIYRTETTAKKCKTQKLKSKNGYAEM